MENQCLEIWKIPLFDYPITSSESACWEDLLSLGFRHDTFYINRTKASFLYSLKVDYIQDSFLVQVVTIFTFKWKTSYLQANITHLSLLVCSPFELYLTSQLRVRVANELGAGNAKGAKFALLVSLFSSLVVGILFSTIVIAFNKKLAMIFSSSVAIINMVNELAVLLAFTILFNSIQPVLSGNTTSYLET